MAGLFTGLIASLVAIVFNVIYRGKVDLIGYAVVMPISIYTAFPFFNLVMGGLYYLFIGHLKKAPQVFAIVILAAMVLSAVLIYVLEHGNKYLEEFKGLEVGLILIEGIIAAIFIPFFVRHPGIYLTDKDIRGEE